MSMTLDLSGKTAFVTGTTSGLGRQMAIALSRAGAKVAITGRRADRLETLKAEIEAEGGTVFARALDVTDEADIKAAMDETEAALGPLDILVNNAGVSSYKPLLEFDGAEYDFVMDVNTKAVFLCALAAARLMIKRGEGGRIINISSIASHTVLKGNTVYCMSKSAVSMMTASLAREWARYGINVTAIAPGYIETEINSDWFASEGGQKQIKSFPKRRLGETSDLDGILVLLCSDQGRFISGDTITVDDAQSKAGI